jgi:2-C-methyl-D-erythritol 4-phosphate cytidylyltransferase
MQTLDAIIVAAGSSRRMGFDKMTADLAGRPVIARTVDAFERCAGVRHIHVVASEENHARFGPLLQGFAKLRPLVLGGAHRHLSVWNGLSALDPTAEFVAVHDGARPLVTTGMIEQSYQKAREMGAACVASPVTDTLKDCPPAVTYNGLLGPAHLPKEVVETLSRELVAAGKSEEFRQRLLNVGLEPLLNTPEDFAKIIAADSAQWNGIMPGLNLKQQ